MGAVGSGTAAVDYIVVLHGSRDLPGLQWVTLSAGSKAGIGIGSALLLCLVIGVIVFFYRRRIKKPRGDDTKILEGKPELDGIGVANNSRGAHELPADEVNTMTELHGGHSSSGTQSSQHGGQVSRIATSGDVEKSASLGTENELSAAHGVSETHGISVQSHDVESVQRSNQRPTEKESRANADSQSERPVDKLRVEDSMPTTSSGESVPNNDVE